MSTPDCESHDPHSATGEAPAEIRPAEIRIDKPHLLEAKASSAKALSDKGRSADKGHSAVQATQTAAAAKETLLESAEQPIDSLSLTRQLRTQAEQLATHLRARQMDIDHREAQLNTQSAQLEGDARNARLWFTERESELDQRTATSDQQQREVQRCLARLADVEAALARRRREWDTRVAAQKQAQEALKTQHRQLDETLRHQQQQIDNRREASLRVVRQALAGLQRRRRELEDHEGQCQPVPRRPLDKLDKLDKPDKFNKPVERQEDSGPHAAELQQRQQRQQRLEEAEVRLAAARAHTEQLRKQLIHDRRELDERTRSEQRRLVATQRRALAELEDKRRALARRGEHTDRSVAALRQLRAEVAQVHRATLEIRLATEELWAGLSGAAPPAELTRSLGRIRTRLADHDRQAHAELAERKKELHALADVLSQQHEQLAQKRRQLEDWARGREETIQQQAARLVAREQQLNRREAELGQQAQQWQADRLGYEEEIRRLRMELDTPATAGVM